MKKLTWAELKEKIEGMDEEWQNADVTIFDQNDGEFYGLCELLFVDETDILDHGHPYLTTFEYLNEEE